MKKQKPDKNGYVFSTNPDFSYDHPEQSAETLPPGKQRLRVKLDTKQRAGKAVTLVEGFTGTDDALQELGKLIKTFCGTGGSARDGFILVQGDQREKVLQWLTRNGYSQAKKAG